MQLHVSSQQVLCRGLVMRMLDNAGAANLDATVCILVSLLGTYQDKHGWGSDSLLGFCAHSRCLVVGSCHHCRPSKEGQW